MININLKPGTKRQAPKGDAMASVRARLRRVRESVKEPGLVLAGGTWLVVVLVAGGLFLATRARTAKLEAKFTQSQDEYKRYHAFVAEKKHEGKARDSILAQIGTISAVDQDRYTWSHILDDVSAAVPDFTWLTSVSPIAVTTNTMIDNDTTGVPVVQILIAGQTNDLQNYTTFLRRLGESPWLTNVVPVKTETVIDKGNRPITAFTVQATFVHADSSHVQSVPLLESVVR
jgi:Tfp pilus assembly protein PilN